MRYIPPDRIELHANESAHYEKILISAADPYGWISVANAMEALFESLQERRAIPEIRWRVFADPELGEQRGKSPEQVFRAHGMSTREIIRHPDFVPYLRYFIEGPDLPAPVVQRFCELLDEDRDASGMLQDQLRAFVREAVRDDGLDHRSAATAVFRLSLELGVEQWARSVREAALSAK